MSNLEKYFSFIEGCRNKPYTGGTHNHHITPKHMGGEGYDDNLIKLDYVDHQKAHIILAECFDEDNPYYKSNIHSANLLNRWVDNTDINLLERLSKLKSKQLYEWWDNLTEDDLTEYKRKMSESSKNMWRNLSNEKKKKRNKKISDKLKGREIHWVDKIKENHADVNGENNPMYGKNHSKETKEKISKKLKGNSNLGGRKGKTFSKFKFYKDGQLMFEANGQKEAKEFCKNENISFQVLCKKSDTWKNWFCDRKKKN